MTPTRRLLAVCAVVLALLWCASLLRHPAPSAGPPQASPPAVNTDPGKTPRPRPPQRLYQLAAISTGPAPVGDPGKEPAKADEVKRWAPVLLGNTAGFSALRAGDTLELPLMDGRSASGRINLVQTDSAGVLRIGGSLADGGTFALGVAHSALTGLVLPKNTPSVYALVETADGHICLLEKAAGSILCVNLPPVDLARAAAVAASAVSGSTPAEAATVPVLSSRPSATTVIYLDFDGETVTDPLWNGGATITAAASGFTSDQMTEVWRRVAEDYKAFNIDVTTDLARYNAVAATYRMRCIVTGNDWYYTAYGTKSGGVAYVGSWKYSGSTLRDSSGASYVFSSTIPCWVFAGNLATTARYVAEAASHEIGHTLGLSHDGLRDAAGTTTNEYYSGRGSGATSWAPVMGVGYYVNLVQFSKGDYSDGTSYANNTENDLALIVATATRQSSYTNHVSYLSDAVAATTAAATALTFTDATTIDTTGLIETSGDADMYKFTTAAAGCALTLVPELSSLSGLQNADVSAILYDASGNVLVTANPESSLFPSMSTTLAAGTYYLKVTGVGEGAATSGYYAAGYSNYGSIGRYQITGTLVLAPVITSALSAAGAVGTPFSYAITADNTPVSFTASGLPSGLALDTATGLIGGTPAAAGTFTVTLGAANAGGTGTATLTLTVQTALAAWMATHGVTDLSADPDGDGITNLLEYASGLDPASASTLGLPFASVVTADNLDYPAITFTIPSGREALLYLVQLSADLASWSDGHAYGTGADNTGTLTTAEVSNQLQADGSRVITVRSATSLADQPRAFLRVKITAP